MSENRIESKEKAWFTMLPNIVDDMGLDPYAFRLYVHLRRVAGEKGACWQSTKTLAKHCEMSAGSVSNAKAALVEKHLINVEKRTANGTQYDHITIVNVWTQNHEAFSKDEPTGSQSEPADSQGEGKNNHSKKRAAPSASTGVDVPKTASYDEWINRLKESKNKQAVIAQMVYALFPHQFPDGISNKYYGYVAKTAKNRFIGGYGRLAKLVWQAAVYHPAGDIMSYCVGLAKGQKSASNEGDDAQVELGADGRKRIKVRV